MSQHELGNNSEKGWEALRQRGAELQTNPKLLHGGNSDRGSGLAGREQAVRLIAGGMSIREVAQALGRSGPCISNWLREPEIKSKLRELNETVYEEIDRELAFRAKATQDKIVAAADEALDKMIDLMRGADSEAIQFRASQDLMDRRQDTSKVHRIDKRSVNVNIDAKWLEAAAAADAEEGRTINGG